MTPGRDMPLLDRVPFERGIGRAEPCLLVMLEGLNGSEHDRDVLLRNTLSPALRMGDFIRRV
jgi:hypothetical protein